MMMPKHFSLNTCRRSFQSERWHLMNSWGDRSLLLLCKIDWIQVAHFCRLVSKGSPLCGKCIRQTYIWKKGKEEDASRE